MRAAIGGLGLVLGGCPDGENPITAVEEVASVRVTVTAGGPAVVVEGQTLQLRAEALNRNGATLGGKAVSRWESSSPAVATVSGSGVVTGVQAGRVTVTAWVEERSGALEVPVEARLQVVTTTLPEGTHTVPYAALLQAAGGSGQ